MEDDQNEDDQNGRRPKWKTTKMEDDKMEDDQNGRRPISTFFQDPNAYPNLIPTQTQPQPNPNPKLTPTQPKPNL